MAKYTGLRSAAVDLEYGKDRGKQRGSRLPMDLNSSAGLMLLDCKLLVFFVSAVSQSDSVSRTVDAV